MVSECGLEPLEAGDADEALRLLETEADQIALLIADVQMPGRMDGIKLANFAHEHWPKIRILVVSGFENGKRKHLLSGIAFLSKPWRPLDVIRLALDAKQSAAIA